MMKNKRRGFTVVELVIVVAVVAILATVLIPTFSNVLKKADESATLLRATRSTLLMGPSFPSGSTERPTLLPAMIIHLVLRR